MKTQKTILAQAVEKVYAPNVMEPTLVIDQFDATQLDIVTVRPVSTDNKPNSPTQRYLKDKPTISTSELKQCPANP